MSSSDRRRLAGTRASLAIQKLNEKDVPSQDKTTLTNVRTALLQFDFMQGAVEDIEAIANYAEKLYALIQEAKEDEAAKKGQELESGIRFMQPRLFEPKSDSESEDEESEEEIAPPRSPFQKAQFDKALKDYHAARLGIRHLRIPTDGFYFTESPAISDHLVLKPLQAMLKHLNDQQQRDLKALSTTLAEKLNDPKVSDKTIREVEECVTETVAIIKKYKTCIGGIQRVSNTDLGEEDEAKDLVKDLDTSTKAFINDVKKYEKTCAKWSLGQKIFIGACTVVGGLVGAVLGAAAGLAAGAAIGGGVGSVVPLFGNIAGAVVAGNVGAIVGIVKGIGLGAAIGTAAATAIMSAGMAYGAKKGAGSSLFMTQQQKFVTGLKAGMQKEVTLDSKDAKKETDLKAKLLKLNTERDEIEARRDNTTKETRGIFERDPAKKLAAKEKEIRKVEEKLDELQARRTERKTGGPKK